MRFGAQDCRAAFQIWGSLKELELPQHLHVRLRVWHRNHSRNREILVLQWMAFVSYVSVANVFLAGHIPLSSKDRIHRWNHTDPDAGKAYIYTGSELSCFGEDDGTSTHCPASKYLLAESP